MINFNLIPNIKRCRDYYLYTQDGKRILDLYRENGSALLGYKFGKMVQYTKNLLEQGLFANYPSIYTNRLEKAILSIFDDYKFIYFFDKNNFKKLKVDFTTYRFFSSDKLDDTINPIFPFYNLDIVVICSKKDLNISYQNLSPILLGAATRIVYDFKLFLSKKYYFEKIVFPVDYKQNGPYIYFDLSDDDYNELFKKMLENNILISPKKEIPSILPIKFS